MAMVITMDCRKTLALLPFFFISDALTAGEWHVTPSIKLTESYSDNLLTTKNDKTSSLITELTPGLKITGKGNHLDLNLMYQLSNVSYQAQSDLNQTYDYYQGDVLFKLLNNKWRTKITANKGRRYSSLSSGIASSQNLTSPNQNDVSNYIIDSSFHAKAADLFTYQIGVQANKSHESGLNRRNSEAYAANMYLGNKPRASSNYWHLSANYREITRSTANTQDFTDYQGEIGVSIIEDFWLFVSYFDQVNNIDSNNSDLNSSSFGGGIRWKPSEKIDIKISYNKNIDKKNSDFAAIELTLKPSRRSQLYFTTGKRFYGNYYSAIANYRLKRFSASLNYNEQISSYNLSLFQTPVQGSLICPKSQSFNIQDCNFSNEVSPVLKPDQQLINIEFQSPDNNNNTYLEKKLTANLNYTNRKIKVSVSLVNSERTDLNRKNNTIRNESSVRLSTSYLLNARAHFGFEWSYSDNEIISAQSVDSTAKDQYISLNYHYKLSRKMEAAITLSNSQRVGTGSLPSFTENRIAVALTKEF